MKADLRDIDYEVIGKLKGTQFPMTIDETSVPKVIDILTNAYSDPEMAVLREAATNAWDSHIAAGNKQPIKVQLPTYISPTLQIIDYGTGMDLDDIKFYFSRYGASQRDDSDDYTGMLGIGCKAPLAYTPQFGFTSVKDGVRYVVNISRNDVGAGTVTVVDTARTAERNGVIVRVPAKEDNNFASKAQRLFQYWQPGTVLVNGKQPKHIEGLKVLDDVLLVKGQPHHVVVMGNVAYPAELPDLEMADEYKMVAFVDIGTLSVSPSRESLRYTPRTKEVIKEITQVFHDAVNTLIEKLVNEAPSTIDALQLSNEWRQAIPALKDRRLTFRGRAIPTTISSPDKMAMTGVLSHRGGLGRYESHREIVLATALHSIWVKNFTLKMHARYKRKLLKYVEDLDHVYIEQWRGDRAHPENTTTIRNFILVDELPEDVKIWIDPKLIIDWNDVKLIKLESHTSKVVQREVAGSYRVLDNSKPFRSKVISAKDIGTSKPVVWVHAKEIEALTGRDQLRLLRRHYRDVTVVLLPANRINKFVRDFPKAVPLLEILAHISKKYKRKINSDIRYAYIVSHYLGLMDHWYRWDEDKIDDPDVAGLIRYLKALKGRTNVNTLARKFTEAQGVCRLARVKFDVPKSPMDKYPLLKAQVVGREIHPHCYIYINAAYKAENKKSRRRKKV